MPIGNNNKNHKFIYYFTTSDECNDTKSFMKEDEMTTLYYALYYMNVVDFY